MPRLLLLEDDRSLIDGLTYSLEKNGFETEIAGTVKEAEKQVTEDTDFDLLLFDVMLPDGNGIALCEKLRSLGIRTPIIFLTASDEETSVIRGLDCGGDDYITKPFSLMVLVSKVNALMRRLDNQEAQKQVMTSGAFTLNLGEMKVYKNGKELVLSKKELQLLVYLWENAGRILSKEKILEYLWDSQGQFVDDNTVAVNISRLKNKLETEEISNVRGLGYLWTGKVTKN